MSPVISEQHYKNGMKKDENGFMDIDWCSSKVLNDWDELRSVFMQANAKKAIAPTQVRAARPMNTGPFSCDLRVSAKRKAAVSAPCVGLSDCGLFA